MTTMNGHSEPNPYVGPRSIQHGEPLHGRNEEVHALFCELQARRIVVLHSPSGAGKSSLVQAGLIPRLVQEKFDVWRPIRVNLDPTGLLGVPEGTNRYLLSAMLSLEEELPEGKRRSAAQLAEIDFGTYLQTRPRRRKLQGRPVVLLFDQFEEVLTVAPRAVDAKREFFATVGQALTDEGFWALFIIREDFLAALAPYRDQIPTRLANTLRLDLLGLERAREAALRPALEAGREFPAVDQLVRDLSTVQVQQANGSFAAEPGLYVEPVQLQVVCRRLWGAMPADESIIDEEHIEQYARVSDSLAGYYAKAVEEAAGGDVVVERAIRQWVGSELVKGGIRSQVRQGPGQSGGLDNASIERLLDSYLIRTEQRAGVNWYELSHDRLVEPVEQDNEEWEWAHLHPVQVQAKLWEDGRRDRALLLGLDGLADAVTWAKDNQARITEGEREFLEQSQALRAEERRRHRVQQVYTMAITLVALLAISLGLIAEKARESTEAAQKLAKAAQKSAETAQKSAEMEKEKNKQLVRAALKQVFEVALRRVIRDDVTFGEIEIETDKGWMPLFEWKNHTLAAANLMEGGGRLVAAGHDQVLRAIQGQDSPFLEVTLQWLRGDQRKRGVAIVTRDGKSESDRTKQLENNLKKLGYNPDINPEPPDLVDNLDVAIAIIDDRYVRFTPEQTNAIHDFVRRGGGLLVVGNGRDWLESGTGTYLTLNSYPMNEIMEDFGLCWNDESIDSNELQKGDDATVLFDNKRDHAIELWHGDEEHLVYFATVEHGGSRDLRTTLDRRWVFKAEGEGQEVGEITIRSEQQTVVIGEAGVDVDETPKPSAPVDGGDTGPEPSASVDGGDTGSEPNASDDSGDTGPEPTTSDDGGDAGPEFTARSHGGDAGPGPSAPNHHGGGVDGAERTPLKPFVSPKKRCVPPTGLVTFEEVNKRRSYFCDLISEWAIVRLENAGSMEGAGFGCRTRAKDTRPIDDYLCVLKAPRPRR